MTITIHYRGQLATALGTSTETIEVEPGTTLQSLIDSTAKRVGDMARLCQTLLVAIDGEQAVDLSAPLEAGMSEITLMPPIAGG